LLAYLPRGFVREASGRGGFMLGASFGTVVDSMLLV